MGQKFDKLCGRSLSQKLIESPLVMRQSFEMSYETTL